MERTTCPNCHAPLDDPHLISCPKCRTVLSTYEQSQQIQQELLTQHKEVLVKELDRLARKRLIRWIAGGFAIIGALSGFGIYQIYSGLTSLVISRIATQFEEPQIRATLTEVAQTRASNIIEDEVRAPVEQVRQSTEQAIKNLEDIKKEVATVQEIETFRRWAMILPNGREEADIYGFTAPSQNKYREDLFKKVLIQENKGIQFSGPERCANENYIKDTKTLISTYPRTPYGYVVLDFCMKYNNNPSLQAEADKAKNVLEKLMRVQPHVLAIDSFYGFLMMEIYGVRNLEETGKFRLGTDGAYIVKDAP